MARVDYRRRKMFRIYAVALLLILSVFILSACNADSGSFDASGGSVSQPSHFIAKLMLGLDEDIAVFGWSVVAFTVILKLVLSPLDIWQKVVSRRNAKAMERMRPQLEALAEKYGDDKQRYQQEQMALYKKEKYSMLGMCLPSIITLVVFFVVFTGFREMVGYQFAQDYVDSYTFFDNVMTEELGEDYESMDKTGENAEKYNAAVDKAQTAVYERYFSEERTDRRGFLWIHNIFVSDNWQDGVPDYLVATGQEGFGMSKITGVMKDEYELVMGKVIGADRAGWGKGDASWNGWMLLPALSIALTFVSQKLLSKSQGAPPPTADGKKGADGMQGSMKMMQYFMPIMIGVFSLFYSAAFALYTFTSSLVSIVFQFAFTVVGKILDKREEKKTGGLTPARR